MTLALAALAALQWGCSVPSLDPTGKACPCTSGWTCDPELDLCVRDLDRDETMDFDRRDSPSSPDSGTPKPTMVGTSGDAGVEDAGASDGGPFDGGLEVDDVYMCPEGGASWTRGDRDQDGVPDCLDPCPDDPARVESVDSDGDGVLDCNDVCPDDPADESGSDLDGDGVADCLDGCAQDPDKTAPGLCGCGVLDADGDSDGDGLLDCVDGCPSDADKGAPGRCGCGVADVDSDGDGVADCFDECPDDRHKALSGDCGCGEADRDEDLDGVADCDDGCPSDADKVSPGVCGCGADEVDADLDSVPDCLDECPHDADKVQQGVCGCGVGDGDADGDGSVDCMDECPLDPNKSRPGKCGCGVSDADRDGDGVRDCRDRCPSDPLKTRPGACGCGQADSDTDGDGVADCQDGCPGDAEKLQPGRCGCGGAEWDADGDGLADCVDSCPDYAGTAPDFCACGEPLADCRLEPGLVRRHYTGNWDRLPDFDSLPVQGESVVKSIDVSGHNSTNAFGLVFEGYLQINVAGEYDFELLSDDGSRLIVDTVTVVNFDGKHSPATMEGRVRLAEGLHPLRVEYFEGAGSEVLRVRYRLRQTDYATIPAAALWHTPRPRRCERVAERSVAQLVCAESEVITAIQFASYGTPEGECGAFAEGSCSAQAEVEIVKSSCVGEGTCSIPVSNEVFGDPCSGVGKFLAVQYVCGRRDGNGDAPTHP